MLFFGHRFIPSKHFYHLSFIDSIKHTPSSSSIYISFSEKNIEILKHCVLNKVEIAVHVKNIAQLLYASALGASYIVVEKELAKSAQILANNYLFDAKILAKIDEEEDIEELAILGVDGVIFGNAIIKVNA